MADRVTELYRRYGPAIYWRCLRLLRDEAAAEDAAQETYLRVHTHLESAPDEALRWIWRIATNYCLNEIRARASRPLPSEALPESAGPESLEELLADRELVARIVARSDEKLRVIAFAHYVDGLDHVEVAARLGLSRRTVAARLEQFHERARKFVRRSA
jgi:RNA polymerase sigma-70 factor, ECF subfamily